MWNKNFVLLLVGLGVASYFLPNDMPSWCWAVWYVFCSVAGMGLFSYNLDKIKKGRQQGVRRCQ